MAKAILSGKGMYLWIIKRVEGGNPAAIAELAKTAGLSHVLIKVADGTRAYNIEGGVDLVHGLASELRKRGIQAWGWQYIYGGTYGNDPVKEAAIAIQRTKQFNLDGFVVNAEVEFKKAGMDKVARQYMQTLRAGLPNTPIGFSSFRYPTLHRPLPFDVFLEYSDINMPQVYWVQASNPVAQLQRSVNEYQALKTKRPIFPTGCTYPDGAWQPTAQQVIDFMQGCKDMGIQGANFWEWYYARRLAGLWPAISQYNGFSVPRKDDDKEPVPQPEPQQPDPFLTMSEKLDRLWDAAHQAGWRDNGWL